MKEYNSKIMVINSTEDIPYEYSPEELWLDPNNLLAIANRIKTGFEEYIDAKKNIYKNSDGILVLNQDNDITNKIESNREVRYFSRHKETNAFYTMDNILYTLR